MINRVYFPARERGEIEARSNQMVRECAADQKAHSEFQEHKSTLEAMDVGEVIDYPFGVVRRVNDRGYRVEEMVRDSSNHWSLRSITNLLPAVIIISQFILAGPHKYVMVRCSKCGCGFGPGDHGFSHCDDHAMKSALSY